MVRVGEYGVLAVCKVTGHPVRIRGGGGRWQQIGRLEVNEGQPELRSKVFMAVAKKNKNVQKTAARNRRLAAELARRGGEGLASSAYRRVLAQPLHRG